MKYNERSAWRGILINNVIKHEWNYPYDYSSTKKYYAPDNSAMEKIINKILLAKCPYWLF